MTETTQAEIRHIYDQWHDSVQRRDLEALMALYADEATLESPLILATWADRRSGILTGKTAIKPFFDAGLRAPPNDLGRWYRTGIFFCNGKQLTWEYPRHTPDGDQVDLVEMMDIARRTDRPSSGLLGMGRLQIAACVARERARIATPILKQNQVIDFAGFANGNKT
jgi:steroid delta-isomerase